MAPGTLESGVDNVLRLPWRGAPAPGGREPRAPGSRALAPRARFLRSFWWLALGLGAVILPAHVVWGERSDWLRDLAFLALILAGWLVERRRPRWGFGVFFAGLLPLATWATLDAGWLRHSISATPVGLMGMSIVPLLGLAFAFSWRGVFAGAGYTLLLAAAFLPWRAVHLPGVFVALVIGVGFGGVLAWLLDDGDRAYRALEAAAYEDALTGLGNRRALGEALDAREGRGGPLSIVILDVNGMKRLNDLGGHKRGDALLQALAAALKASFPAGWAFYRLGGDEFAGVSAALSGQGALPAAMAGLHGGLNAAGFAGVTVSAGLRSTAWASDPRALMHAADEAMYAFKVRLQVGAPGEGNPPALTPAV